MKHIGIITSGGDSPGMNACIRAVVRTAHFYGIRSTGFIRGYDGLIDDVSIPLTRDSVSGIIQRGGTILKSARSPRFMESEGIAQAAANLKKHGIEGFVVIGGDGSFKGAIALSAASGIPIMGCAGTIDNDLVGTDFTIGYDTAINTVVEAIDKIRDTADSHERVFVIEVMGRDAGLIALRSAIACGAEAVMVPEMKDDLEHLVHTIRGWDDNKKSRIVVVAEGDHHGGAFKIAEVIRTHCPHLDLRVSVLGHIQRGGNPTCMERVNASIVGNHAVRALMDGRRNEMVGIVDKHVHFTPFEKAVKHHTRLKKDLTDLIDVLSAS